MKPLAITAAILLLVTTDISASGRQRRLSKETAPVDTAGIMSSNVWDFSGVSVIDPDSRALSEAHGDTLISESWPGRQEWLGWDGDTISYLGGESLSRIVSTTDPARLFGFPLSAGSPEKRAFAAAGRVYSRLPYSELGYVESRVGATGVLITASGDTLANVTVTMQAKDVAAGVNRGLDDLRSLPADSAGRLRSVTYRWYAPADPLPVAMLHVSETGARAFVMDGGDTPVPPACLERVGTPDPRAAALALANARVSCGGGRVTVSVTSPADCLLEVRADVIDVAGNSYLSRTRQCGGETDIEIPTGGLPRGEYLLAISSPSAPSHVEKRQILIR